MHDELKKAMLAAVGAAAVTAEKAREAVDGLAERGEAAVEQGRAMTDGLRRSVGARMDLAARRADLAAQMAGLSEEELKTFLKLCDRVYDSFGVPCGNRFVGQLKKAVPVFVACGGEKATALDFLFASKILRRAVKKPAAGREAEIRALTRCIREHYGKNVFVRSAAMLAEWTAPAVKDD